MEERKEEGLIVCNMTLWLEGAEVGDADG